MRDMYVSLSLSWQVLGSTVSEDFFSHSASVEFGDGATEADGILVLTNDLVPEGNETFTVRIADTRFGAEVGSVSTMQLTISANDEPHGEFTFQMVS